MTAIPAVDASSTEQTVARIWCDVLGRPIVDADANFFDLGGHSVLVHMVSEQLTEAFGTSPELVELFRHPTVRSLAALLDGASLGASAGGAGAARLVARDRVRSRAARVRAAGAE